MKCDECGSTNGQQSAVPGLAICPHCGKPAAAEGDLFTDALPTVDPEEGAALRP